MMTPVSSIIPRLSRTSELALARLRWWRTLNAMRTDKALDAVCLKLSRILPKRLVYWCYLRIGAYATMGKYGQTVVPELTMMDALNRFSRDEMGYGQRRGVR